MIGNVSKVSGSFHAEPARIAAENARAEAEAQRELNETERQKSENTREIEYNTLHGAMEDGIRGINERISSADSAINNTNLSADNANSAASAAASAAALASQKADLADEKAELANAKSILADEKASLANSAAIEASSAASVANSAAAAANTSKANADTATANANTAASAANEAASRITEPLQAKNIAYDNTDSGIDAENIEGAVNFIYDDFETHKTDFDTHKTSAQAHAEAFALERTRFNPLYANALLGSAAGNNITVSDAVEGTPISLSLYGACSESLGKVTGFDKAFPSGGLLIEKDITVKPNTTYKIRHQSTNNLHVITSPVALWSGCMNGVEGHNPVYSYCVSNNGGRELIAPSGEFTFTTSENEAYINITTGNTSNNDGLKVWDKIQIAPAAEKSPDNPVPIRGVGESGSVTVTVTPEGGTAQEITIPLDSPLYGIKHTTTGEWLVRDEIISDSGRVILCKNIARKTITGQEVFHYLKEGSFGTVFVHNPGNVKNIASGLDNGEHRKITSTLFKTGYQTSSNMPLDTCLGYAGSHNGFVKFQISRERYGAAAEDTKDEKVAKFKSWIAEYNAGHETPFQVYYAANIPTITDITDTEAGQALLSLAAQNGATIVNSEGADMAVEYNRDVNKAFEELQNAVAALNAAAVDNI